MSGDFLALANDLATKGWEPLALPKGEKFPPPPGTTGRNGAPLPPEQWANYPDHDAAVRMPRGVVGLDFDAYKGDAIALQEELEAKHGRLPDTWESSSRPWPARIAYFRLPEGHESHEFPGSIGCIDFLQNHHRYARISGIHAETGAAYAWTDPDGHPSGPPFVEDLPEIPIGWLEIAPEAPQEPLPESYGATQEVMNALQGGLRALDGAAGSRHDGVAAAIMALANLTAGGHETTAAVHALHAEWMRVMTPERGEHVAAQEIANMISTAKAKAVPSAPPAQAVEDFIAQGTPTQPAQRSETGYWDSVALDLTDLEQLPDLQWAIQDCIPEGAFSTLYGPTGIGKTFVMLDMVLTLASGLPWHGNAAKQQKVLYLVGEGIHGYKKRVRAWRHEHPDANPDGNVVWSNAYGASLRSGDTLGSLLGYVKANRFTFIVVDTVNMFAGGIDENSSKDMTEFTTAMTVLANETGATVVAVHHTGKDVKNGARGSSVFASTVNSSILVTRDAELPELTLRFDKLRDAEAGARLKLEMYSVPEADSACLRRSHLQAQRTTSHMQEIVRKVHADGQRTAAKIRSDSPVGPKQTDELVREATRQNLLTYDEKVYRPGPAYPQIA